MEPMEQVRSEAGRGPAPDRRGWARSLVDVTREHGFTPLRVEGTIPAELRGTLYRNGPGRFGLFGHRYRHWFDGDGLISAVRFGGGEAEGAVRLLQTPGLLEERRRGEAYFGAYGTAAPGFFNPLRALRTARGTAKNPANTSVLAWADRTFALCEIGRPFEFDPNDLTSMAETDLGGAIPRAFSAHPHRVASDGRVYNIGVRVGKPALLDAFLLRPDGSAGHIVSLPLDFSTLIHDFAVTERALVVFVAPLPLALLRTLFGMGAFADNLRWEPERGTEVIVIPLDAPASPIRFHVDPFWVWHVGNAFEQGGEIVVDLVRYRDFPSTHEWLSAMTRGGPNTDADGLLGRARIDPKRQTMRFEPVGDRTGEFPRVAPVVDAQPNRTLYWTEHSSPEVGRHGPPDSVVRVDMQSGDFDRYVFEAGETPSEAVYVPRSGSGREDDGWLVSLVYDAASHTSAWTVFDAVRVADGPIATAHLDHHVPLSFHGAWVPA